MLTRSISHVLEDVYSEVDAVLDREVGKGDGKNYHDTAFSINLLINDSWKGRAVPLQPLLLTIFLHVYQRVFVGADLAKNKTWVNITTVKGWITSNGGIDDNMHPVSRSCFSGGTGIGQIPQDCAPSCCSVSPRNETVA